MAEKQPCTIGRTLNEECHMLTISRKVGFFGLEVLSYEQKKVLEWRCGIILNEDSSLCYHHEKKYMSRYEYLEKYCCDPLKLHKKQIKSKFLLRNPICIILCIVKYNILLLTLYFIQK